MLARLERRTPESRIDLGLDRVRAVFERLDPDLDGRRVLSVAGTNGKGSTVAFAESILRAGGVRCMAYVSPHLVDFCERYRIDGRQAGAGAVLDALNAVEAARADEDLTYFEHVTLAAFRLAADHDVEVLILEVGLGGRLDAVNIVDADVAVITSIGLDHQAWLGRTRRAIAREKCGIARSGRPVVVAEKRPPTGMFDHLESIGADLLRAGTEFDWRWSGERLTIRTPSLNLRGVVPGLAGRHQAANAAAAVMAVQSLPGVTVEDGTIERGIESARLDGRLQTIDSDPVVVVDVAHNPAAARVLAAALRRRPGRKRAVFAVLSDKDAVGIARALDSEIDHWYAAGLPGPRGRTAIDTRAQLELAAVKRPPEALESVPEALARARADCRGDDQVIVFGSFLTVAEAIRLTRNG